MKKIIYVGIAEPQESEAEKNTNRIVQRNSELLKSLEISDEQSSNLDLLFEDVE